MTDYKERYQEAKKLISEQKKVIKKQDKFIEKLCTNNPSNKLYRS